MLFYYEKNRKDKINPKPKQKDNCFFFFFACKGKDVVLMLKKRSKSTKLSPINIQITFRSL